MGVISGPPTRVTFNGVDISNGVRMVRMDVAPPTFSDEALLMVGEVLAPIRITGKTIKLTPAGYQVLLGRRHPRITSLRTAYDRKRRGWRN